MIDVVIPVYHPGQEFQELIQCLLQQTVAISHIWVMQTIQQEGEPLVRLLDDRITVIPVLQQEFDHGGTRDLGARQSKSEYILFMTQDAMPENDHLLECLLQAMEDPRIGIAYARQLPRASAGFVESLTRTYNYPPQSSIKKQEDEACLGIKTYFCSDVCAMYRRCYYEELGGFVCPTVFNEDMIMAYAMLHAGYQVAYCAEAQVVHSHEYSCMQQFRRNFDLGVSQKQYEKIFAAISSEKEGAGYAKKIIGTLVRMKKIKEMFYFMLQCGFKLFGYKLGLHYRHLPKGIIMQCTGSKWYWKTDYMESGRNGAGCSEKNIRK